MKHPIKPKPLSYHLLLMLFLSVLSVFISCAKEDTYLIVNGSYPDCSFPGYTGKITDKSSFQGKSKTGSASLLGKDSFTSFVPDAYLLNKK